MTHIVTIRTARKEHSCSRCNEPIEPGDRYAASSLTPHDADIGNRTWRHHVSHLGAWLPPDRRATKADHERIGWGCDEAAAYRERDAAMQLEGTK